MTSNQNNDGGNDGWGSQPNRWQPPFYVTEWERQSAEENAQAAEVRNVVSELLEHFGGINCEGLIYHISRFVGNRLVGRMRENEPSLHHGWQTGLDEDGLLPRREVAAAALNEMRAEWQLGEEQQEEEMEVDGINMDGDNNDGGNDENDGNRNADMEE